MFLDPRAVERRASDRFKTYPFQPGRTGKDLWLFENRDHIGVIQQIALGVTGELEALLRIHFGGDVYQQVVELVVAEAVHLVAGAAFLQQGIAVIWIEHALHHVRVGASHFRDGEGRFQRIEVVENVAPGITGLHVQGNSHLTPLLRHQLQHLFVLRLRQGFIDGQGQALAIFGTDAVAPRFPARLIQQFAGFRWIKGQLVAEVDKARCGVSNHRFGLRIVW